MTAAHSDAQRLADALVGGLAPLGVDLPVCVEGPHPSADWAASGAMALTGAADGPALPAPGAPATALRAALAVVSACAPPGSVPTGPSAPSVRVLGERAASAGFTRNAPRSPGGAFQALPARDGWLGVSLARPDDIETVPALVGSSTYDDPWHAVADWLRTQDVRSAQRRAQLLGLPTAVIAPPTRRRPVRVALGGPRRPVERPLVLDLTSLWAGPLCAHLLGLHGARVIKVESVARPDGARAGPEAFFDLLHAGHESVVLDFAGRRADLARLVAAADVVLEASRPRALEQLGLRARSFAAAGGIWVSITAYGRSHPMRVGFGDDVAAGAGLVAWIDGHPTAVGDALADPLAGAFAAAATSVALRSRRGCLLDVSMHDVAAAAARFPARPLAEVSVEAPRARPPVGRARPAGADTDRVLAEFC